MADDDIIDQNLSAAIKDLYRLNRIRPSAAQPIAKTAMQNLAYMMGYELVLPTPSGPDAGISGPLVPSAVRSES